MIDREDISMAIWNAIVDITFVLDQNYLSEVGASKLVDACDILDTVLGDLRNVPDK